MCARRWSIASCWRPSPLRRRVRPRPRSPRRRPRCTSAPSRCMPAATWCRHGADPARAGRPGASPGGLAHGLVRVVPGVGARRGEGDDRGRGGGPGLPVDRFRARVPRALPAAARDPEPAAGRQPRHRRVGADRLPGSAGIPGEDDHAPVRCDGGRVRPPPRPRPARQGARRDTGLGSVRDRLRDARPGGRDPGARRRAGRPVRGFLRLVVRAVVCVAVPAPAAFGGARLHLLAGPPVPVVRVDRHDRPHRLPAGLRP